MYAYPATLGVAAPFLASIDAKLLEGNLPIDGEGCRLSHTKTINFALRQRPARGAEPPGFAKSVMPVVNIKYITHTL